MQGTLELDSADMPFHPADRPLDGFESIKFDPNALSDRRPLNELDLAARGRRIEHAHPERTQSRPPNSDLRVEDQPLLSPRLLRTRIGTHGQGC